MDSKIINRRDLDFVLYELLEVEALTRAPRFAEHSRETFGAAIDTALQIATDRFAPHNRKADLNEPKFDGERVALIPEVGDALKAFMAAGLLAATQRRHAAAAQRGQRLLERVQGRQHLDRHLRHLDHRRGEHADRLRQRRAEAPLHRLPARAGLRPRAGAGPRLERPARHGGYGYTREYAVEQFYRDNRLNSIHEGTDGIQALDLLGRKVLAANGAGMERLGEEIARSVTAAHALDDETLAQHAQALAQAWRDLQETTRVLSSSMELHSDIRNVRLLLR